MKNPIVHLSLWLGILLCTQSGCSHFNPQQSSAARSAQIQDPYRPVPRPQPPQQTQQQRPPVQQQRPPAVAQRSNPNINVPSNLPAGARIKYNSIRTDQKVIAMTFDDGPHPVHTPRLLKIMKDRNIKGTFYVVGKNAKAYPHIMRQIIAEGHEVGNHTYNHPSLTSIPDQQIRTELRSTRDAVYDATGIRPQTMRPPYGAINQRIQELMFSEFGYPTIMWSVDPEDWRKPGVSVVTSRLVNSAHPGAILLAHDIHATTIQSMPAAFDQLLAKGYRFVTVSQLINIEKASAPLSSVPPASMDTAALAH